MKYEMFWRYDGYTYECFNYGGKNLRHQAEERAKNSNDWTEAELLDLYTELVKMLKALFDASSIHRRINPKALVFGENGKMMLTNFDALRIDAEISKTISRTTAMTEDTQFLAPEYQSEDNPTYKYKVDVYAMGMVMMYMATAVE